MRKKTPSSSSFGAAVRAFRRIPDHVPRKDRTLPRALTPEQDQLIQQELLRRNDLASNVLLLQRHTGMRIGECADLSLDCMRSLGLDQWAILVPLGKLQTERWVPVDSFVCRLVDRLRVLWPQNASDGFLMGRPRARETLIRGLRATLREVAAAAGIITRIVPHQFRHTYATEMLRAGVTFAGLMQLLGHSSPEMTMAYLKTLSPICNASISGLSPTPGIWFHHLGSRSHLGSAQN